MEDEVEGIKDLIVEYVKGKKKVKIGELAAYLSLNDKIVWQAVDSLQDDGSVFMPDEASISPVEKF